MGLQTGGDRAIILAAGLGTRLGRLTAHKPKALVEWEGSPLIDHVIRKLKKSGFTDIIINVHHHAEMIMEHLDKRAYFGMHIEFSHEKDELLDTGGGIANASWFFDDRPFLVYNVDILSSIDLSDLMKAHRRSGCIATMAVKQRLTTRSLLMDHGGFLKGWRDNRSGETILVDDSEAGLIPIAFSAIHVMDPRIFKLFPLRSVFPSCPFTWSWPGRKIYLCIGMTGMSGSIWENWRPIPIYRFMEFTGELKTQIEEWNLSLKGKSAQEVIGFFLDHFGEKILLSTSLGLEDQVLTEMVLRQNPGLEVFTLDTGRLFPETYDLIARTNKHFGIRMKTYFPDAEEGGGDGGG